MAIRSEGYSIWIQPEGEIKIEIDKLITNLAADHQTPAFPAHVTLLGKITGLKENEVISRFKSLGNNLSPFDLKLNGELIMERVWNRALAIRATQTYPLIVANRLAREVFDMREPRPDDLHMSFLYAEGVHETPRLEIYRELPTYIKHLAVPVTNIHLWKTTGHPSEWQQVATFPLNPKENTK